MSTMGPEGSNESFVSEDELKSLLECWIAPQPSKTLDQRVANSYHRVMDGADPTTAAIGFPKSQNEVVKMKFCSTCNEEFADKFGFCPVDGTPLNVLVSKREESADSLASASVSSASVPSASVSNEDVPTTNVPVEPFSVGEPVIAGAGSMALMKRGELHLTIIDDAGLVGRLAKEVSDVAHEYQLTWPEFKRDPFGFTKRSLVGYGQMASKFFGNRNVIAGLIVAVIALAALLGIMALLDRAQPGGISRTGFVTYAAIALVILA
jgi:hypothetical protein